MKKNHKRSHTHLAEEMGKVMFGCKNMRSSNSWNVNNNVNMKCHKNISDKTTRIKVI